MFRENAELLILNPQQQDDLLIPDYDALLSPDVEDANFVWTTWEPERTQVFSNIVFEDGILAWMRVWRNHTVTLDDVLEAYGNPEIVSVSGGIGTLSLTLQYPEIGLAVELVLLDPSVSMSALRENFTVDFVYYVTPEAFETLAEQQHFDRYVVEPDVWAELDRWRFAGNRRRNYRRISR